MKTASIYVRFDVQVPDEVPDESMKELGIEIQGFICVTEKLGGIPMIIRKGAEVTNYETEEVANIELNP